MKLKRYILYVVVVLCMIGLAIYYAQIDINVALKAKTNTVSVGTASVTCTLRNSSLRQITYGETFFLEYFTGSEWIELNESGHRWNFELGSKFSLPFSSVEITYPVYLYSSLETAGDYRIVIQVYVGKDSYTLFCPFSVQ